MCKQYIEWEDHAHSDTLKEHSSHDEWEKFNSTRRALKRKRFNARPTIWKAPKRRRLKTFQCIMQLNNMLELSAGVSLSHFLPGESCESAYDQPHLDLCPDMGPDMVCLDHALTYYKQLNITCHYDIDHATSNTGKCALKQSGLWSTAILMASANNCVYGSALRT